MQTQQRYYTPEECLAQGWLIDRHHQQAWMYRDDQSITQFPAAATLSGDKVVPGFTLALRSLL